MVEAIQYTWGSVQIFRGDRVLGLLPRVQLFRINKQDAYK